MEATLRFADSLRRARAKVAYAAGAALLAAFACSQPARTPVQRVAEAAAHSAKRLAVGRLSPPFPYVKRGADGATAKIAFSNLAGSLPAGDFRAMGTARLLGGDTDDAIPLLERAARQRNDADSWNDLAAARLNAYENDPTNAITLVDALSAADHALSIDPKHAAAAFNRAAILQRLGLLQEAIGQWEQALALDPASPWADDALAALHQLRFEVPPRTEQRAVIASLQPNLSDAELTTTVRQHPRLVRRTCESLLLGQWGAAEQKGDRATADARLNVIRRIGAALRMTGDAFVGDAVKAIDDAHDDPARRAQLAAASVAYDAGRRAFGAQKPSDAETKFRDAQSRFESARSPMALVAKYSVAQALYAEQRTADAERALDAIAAERVEDRGYHALAGQIGWERGLTKIARGDFSSGRNVLAAARTEFERCGEREAVAAMDSFIADGDDFAGDPEGAWPRRIVALTTFSRTGETARKITAIDATSTAMIARGEWDRAAALLNIATRTAAAASDPVRAAHAFTDRSIALAETGDRAHAQANLREARRWSSLLTDTAQRRALEERALFAEALVTTDPRRSIDVLSADIARLLETNRSLYAVRLLVERAQRKRALHDDEAARADLAQAMSLMESERASVTSLDGRALFAGTAAAVTHEAVMNAFDRGAPGDAFAAIERWRGRAVLDALDRRDDQDGAAAQPMPLDQIAQTLDPRAAIVEYAVLPDRLVIFVVRSQSIVFVERPQDPSDLQALVRRLNAALNRPRGASDRSLADAYAAFVAPIENALAGAQVVAFVADSNMALPFPALHATGMLPLSERFATVIAPSATLAIRCSLAARDRTGSSLAAVAGDAFDPNIAGLRPLPDAAREVQGVASMYANRTVLTGTRATRRELARIAAAANVLHFAGHATAAGSRSADSALFVAPHDDNGVVTAAEVSRWKLPSLRLAFLSGCRTGRPASAGDGIENLATAFVVAGTPTVIAASWDIEDQTAATTAVAFHRSFSSGRGIAESLRSADGPNATVWPPMTIFGGLPELVRR